MDSGRWICSLCGYCCCLFVFCVLYATMVKIGIFTTCAQALFVHERRQNELQYTYIMRSVRSHDSRMGRAVYSQKWNNVFVVMAVRFQTVLCVCKSTATQCSKGDDPPGVTKHNKRKTLNTILHSTGNGNSLSCIGVRSCSIWVNQSVLLLDRSFVSLLSPLLLPTPPPNHFTGAANDSATQHRLESRTDSRYICTVRTPYLL